MYRSIPAKSLAAKLSAAVVLMLLSSQLHALDDQWYLGIGGGLSILLPNPDDAAIDRDTERGIVGTVLLGRDFDSRSSGQFQLFSLGKIDFDNPDTARYSAAEAALLYRFYDSRDNRRGNSAMGVSIYGRFGLGYINRESGQSLKNETPVYFGAGAGVETYITRNLSLRFEGQYFDADAASATISMIGRFGGLRRDLTRRPPPINRHNAAIPGQPEPPETDELPETALLPETAVLPETAQLPETAVLPETALLPDTAVLPETALLPDTAVLPETALLPDTAVLPQVTLLPETAQPDGYTQPQPAATDRLSDVAQQPTPTTLPADSSALPDVEIMTGATEASEPPTLSTIATQQQLAAIPQSTEAERQQSTPTVADADGDTIADQDDVCPDSPAGFPVGDEGCGLLGGEITGLQFESDSVTLVGNSTDDLDYIARLLVQHPDARIELISHTDNTGTESEQSRRTRGRLQSIGMYLIDQGVRSRQLILRSFAAKRPKFDNNTLEGRQLNNRVELIERPR